MQSFIDKSLSNIGLNIRRIRIEKGITQEKLCKGYISRHMLSKIENGKALPSLEVLLKIANALEADPSELIACSGSGNASRNDIVLDMIRKEYMSGNTDICLEYARAMEDKDDLTELLCADASYRSGVDLYMNGNIHSAREKFSESLKYAYGKTEQFSNIGNCRCYGFLASAFIDHHEKDDEYAVLNSIVSIAGCSLDILLLARINLILCKCGTDAAEQLLSITSFESNEYESFSKALLNISKDKHSEALRLLLETVAYNRDPFINCWCLSLLEKCTAKLGDFEKAYSYSRMRDSEIDKLFSE